MRYQQPFGISDPDGPYINGNPAAGIQGSIPPAAAFEEPMREIVNAIKGAGLSPSGGTNGLAGGDLMQLWRSMQLSPWVQETAPDVGVKNAPAITLVTTPPQLYPGMTVRVNMAFTNDGPCTLTVFPFGTHALKRANGAELQAGDLTSGMLAVFVFDGANFQVLNFSGIGGTGGSGDNINNYYMSNIPYAVDSGSVNVLVGTFTPTVTSLVAGTALFIKVSHTNTSGTVTLQADGTAAKPLVWPDGNPFTPGSVIAGGIFLVVYDGVNYQLMTRVRNPQPPYYRGRFSFYSPANVGSVVPDSVAQGPPEAGGVPWPPGPPLNQLVDSTYVNGKLTIGPRDAGLWALTMWSALDQYGNDQSIVIEHCMAGYDPSMPGTAGAAGLLSEWASNAHPNMTGACPSVTAITRCVAGEAFYFIVFPRYSTISYGMIAAVRLGD